MTNKPTRDQIRAIKLMANIIDYIGLLDNENITIETLKKLRTYKELFEFVTGSKQWTSATKIYIKSRKSFMKKR